MYISNANIFLIYGFYTGGFMAYSCAFGISFIHDKFLKRRVQDIRSIKNLHLNKLSLISFIVLNVVIAAVGFTIILNKNIQNSLIIWASDIKGKPVGAVLECTIN